MRAETTRVSTPSTKPKPRPSTRPAGIRRKKTGSNPATAGLGMRSAAPQAARIPRSAMALASSDPSARALRTTARSRGRTAMKIHGASAEWAWLTVEVPCRNRGQANATMPTTDVTARRIEARDRSRTTAVTRRRSATDGLHVECRANLLDREPRLGRQDLRDLGREHRRMADDVPGWTVGHHLAVGQDHR